MKNCVVSQVKRGGGGGRRGALAPDIKVLICNKISIPVFTKLI